MYPAWLLDGIASYDGALTDQLGAAQQLVPEALLVRSGLAEDVRGCAEDGYNHLWLDALCQVGRFAEAQDRDDELPPEFWARLAQAAHVQEFPQFVPYCLGKAQRLPRQDPADLIAAFVTMPAALGRRWSEYPMELEAQRSRAETVLRENEPDCVGRIDAGDLTGLAGLLRAGGYDRNGQVLSTAFSEAFDDLFEVVAAKDFPAERAAHAWAVIGTNPFTVVLGGGLSSLSGAEVWWRA
ncbi:MAG: hypothetical protein WCA46_27350 [Actinocatenispora sp.]